MLQATWNFDTVLKSLDLLMIKFGDCRSKDCKVTGHQTLPLYTLRSLRPKSMQAPSAQIGLCLESNHSQSLMASNFATLWRKDPKFSALKDLKPFKTVPRIQEAGCILRVGFACSKWPHLHRAYVVTVRKLNLHSVTAIFHFVSADCLNKSSF